ncbi:MAG TPA: hypothetical protein VLH60_03880 [Sedimentisphaerales bacterium]|nr:hypothetical protein [Sedimentisphaerales bacterium]
MKRRIFAGLSSVFRTTYAVLCITAILIYAAHLRGSRGQVFFRIRQAQNQEMRIKQSLWQKQIELEGLVNPASVWEHAVGDGEEPED